MAAIHEKVPSTSVIVVVRPHMAAPLSSWDHRRRPGVERTV